MEAIFSAVEEKLRRSPEVLHFATLDFDHSCILGDIAETVLEYLCGADLLRDQNLLPDFQGGKTDYHRLVLERAKFLRGMESFRFAAEALAGFKKNELDYLVLSAIKSDQGRNIGLRPHTMPLLRYLENKRISVWIVSASAQALVARAMFCLGITARLIGIRNKVRDGIIQRELEEPISAIEGKVECIKREIHPTRRPVLALGDSLNDLPMLEYAQVPVVVDRGNALRDIALERSWFLI